MPVLQTIAELDHRTFSRIFQSRRHPQVVPFFRVISRSADGWPYIMLPVLYLLLDPSRGEPFLWLVAFSFGLERVLYLLLKNTCKRRRPPALIPGFQSLVSASDEFSFPSAHTSGAFLMATLCLATFGPLALPLYLWAALVGFSRLVLGVHFLTDVIVGALLGIATAAIGLNLLAH